MKRYLPLLIWAFLMVGAYQVHQPGYSIIIDKAAPYAVAFTALCSIVLGFFNCNSAAYAIFVITSIFFGIAVEALGVATGFPFGQYSYANILGPKVLDVPVVIGFSWASVICLTYFIAGGCCSNRVQRLVLGVILVIIFDYCLEPAAISLGYWSWADATPPIRNYMAWGTITLIFHLIAMHLIDENVDFIKNRLLMLHIFCAQQAFFVLVS